MELYAKMFYSLEAFNCSTRYLASMKLHLKCLIGFYSKCASESCSVLHYEDTSHSQRQPNSRFFAVFKNTISCKTKVKLGQMNWWTKLINNIVIDSLYNFENNQSLLSQWKLPCAVAITLFSSRDLVFPEVRHLWL